MKRFSLLFVVLTGILLATVIVARADEGKSTSDQLERW